MRKYYISKKNKLKYVENFFTQKIYKKNGEKIKTRCIDD